MSLGTICLPILKQSSAVQLQPKMMLLLLNHYVLRANAHSVLIFEHQSSETILEYL
jgi:hypothetical protein